MRNVPAAVEPVGVGFNLGAVAMNAMRGIRRWLWSGEAAVRGSKPRASSRWHGYTGPTLLLLAAATLAAPAQYQFWTGVNRDGTLTLY